MVGQIAENRRRAWRAIEGSRKIW